MNFNLPACWLSKLQSEFEKPYWVQLNTFLHTEIECGKTIYPPLKQIFNAFHLCTWEKTKVVILGQDPYHNENQAHGLAFSVNKGVRIPPSLNNIFKELQNNFPDFQIPTHGNLNHWAEQGVLLLNATLTVEAHKAGSHQKKGWEQFSDAVIQKLAAERENLVFILWGNYAQKKAQFIPKHKHLILSSVHPSPLSAHQGEGFWYQNHFLKTNAYLKENGQSEIDWKITSI